METLKIIWTSLSNENKLIIDVISIPMLILESIIIMLFFTQIFNIYSTKKQKTIYATLVSIVGLFSQFFVSAEYITSINTIALFVLIFCIFKINLLKTILSAIIPSIIFVIVGSTLQLICFSIFHIPNALVISIPIYRLSFSLIMYAFLYFLYLLLKHFHVKITLFDDMHKPISNLLAINFSVGILAISAQSIIAILYGDEVSLPILLFNIFALCLYFIISIFSLFRTNNLEITQKNLEEEKLYNKTLNIFYDKLRVFKHDFNNIVQAIGGYVSTDNMEGLKIYYSELLDDCQILNNLTVLSPEVINNPAIYSLITSKYHKADELGIKMNIEAFLDLTKVNINLYHLSKIFGILLDNAIDAASKCDEKIINVIIRKDPKANRKLFLIENTYLNKNIDTDEIFEKGFTSKTEEDTKAHGLGLWEVRQILKKSNNLNLYTSKNEVFFKQQLEIYY